MKMLRQIRKLRNLSVPELSQLTNIPERRIKRYEAAESKPESATEPDWATAGVLADALGVSLDQLAGRAPLPEELAAQAQTA
jgi:transcriptional regulator with XRE-family HTH domain